MFGMKMEIKLLCKLILNLFTSIEQASARLKIKNLIPMALAKI
jgi:hypothetical protein